MEIEQIEKQFQMWIRFLWMIFGTSITLGLVSFGTIVYGAKWSGFGNYVGRIWSSIQFLAILPGFYLLWGKRWKPIPFSSRIQTIFGYFVASWLNMLALGFVTETAPATDYYLILVGSAVLIILAYIWARKKTSISKEEIFP